MDRGARLDGDGTRFVVWAPDAEAVEVCLPAPDGEGAERRIALRAIGAGDWEVRLPGVGAGTRYGLRVHGPWSPEHGHRFNASKLLLDPYALAVTGELVADDAVLGHDSGADDTARDGRDSAAFVPHGVVVDLSYDWQGDRPPRTPWSDTVIYEAHVRALTARHPAVPAHERGTYAGLSHPAVLEHLVALGITAVELLPVHAFTSELALLRRGARNAWGYNTVGFFAPHAGYSSAGSSGGQVREFRDMVRALHAAGLEVLLDVVYNHTAEGDEHGPTLSMRGIANAHYYRLRGGRHYIDHTGCGNTLDLTEPAVLRLVLDSLRHWVSEMHVDGFRFDLAPALLRAGPIGGHEVDVERSGFLAALHQDPVLRDVKLVAEAWDLGPAGYHVGRFPAPWAEWNDRFRDDVRDFWRGAAPGVRGLALRIAGSSDLYAGRSPLASVNLVTAHDGFTARDLVSYDRKHNEANGEHGHDGSEDNRSSNGGVEGDTGDAAVLAHRARQVRNLLSTLVLSAGVPMLVAGDEMGRTQRGNNNAYCLDDATTWLDWERADLDLLRFTCRLFALRREHPGLRRDAFWTGTPPAPGGAKDLAWLAPDGTEDVAWWDPGVRTLGVCVRDGSPGRGLLLWAHSGAQDATVTLPAPPYGSSYAVLLDTAGERRPGEAHPASATLRLPPRSLLLLREDQERAPRQGVASRPSSAGVASPA